MKIGDIRHWLDPGLAQDDFIVIDITGDIILTLSLVDLTTTSFSIGLANHTVIIEGTER